MLPGKVRGKPVEVEVAVGDDASVGVCVDVREAVTVAGCSVGVLVGVREAVAVGGCSVGVWVGVREAVAVGGTPAAA